MPEPRPTPRELPDVDSRRVLAISLGFLLFVAIGMAILAGVYGYRLGGYRPAPPAAFPAPELQTNPLADLRRLQDEQRARLAQDGWADQSRGLRLIPIERAMDLIAARGAQAYDPIETAGP
jgi:hypothetical protein